jgi:hypothetical protein
MKLKLNWSDLFVFVIVCLTFINIPLFSMAYDIACGPDDSEEDARSYIETLDDELLKNMEIKDWVDRPMLSEDLLYLTNKFIQNTCILYKSFPWLYDRSVDAKIKSILEWNYRGEMELRTSTLPCIAKLIVQPDAHVEIIGDVHGDMDTIEGIFDSLKHKNLINELMYMPDNVRIIFLGDLTDRGDFNLQTLASALILSAKNPGKVFLLKGNHEFCISKQSSEVLNEIKKIEKDGRGRNRLISNTIKVYELMPVGMILGYEGQKQMPLFFLAHGGPDIRYDYSDLLNMRGIGLCFWMPTSDDLLKTPKIQDLFRQISSRIAQSAEAVQALELHIRELPAHGFLWNDIIDFPCTFPVFKSKRGGSCIALSTVFIQHFLELFTNENVKFVGLIRGHQHRLAKKIGTVPDSKTMSPSCSYFTSNPKRWLLLPGNTPVLLNNTFLIMTVISGQIQDESKIIQYSPTFLDLSWTGSNSWRLEAIEHD